MPQEIMREFTGKVCQILSYGEISGIQAKIVAVEGNWIKVQTKKELKLINSDLVTKITILADKYQW